MFVFPFVKVFQNDPFVCFEAVATIICKYFSVQSPNFFIYCCHYHHHYCQYHHHFTDNYQIVSCQVRVCMVNLKGLGEKCLSWIQVRHVTAVRDFKLSLWCWWRLKPYGMWCCVSWQIVTGVPKGLAAFAFRVLIGPVGGSFSET